MKKLLCGLLVAATTIPCAGGQPLESRPRALDSEIRSILGERIDRFKQSVGVGVIEPRGKRIVSYGLADNEAGAPVSGDSRFPLRNSNRHLGSNLKNPLSGEVSNSPARDGYYSLICRLRLRKHLSEVPTFQELGRAG